MKQYKVIAAIEGQEVWAQVKKDLSDITYPFVYNVNIQQDGHTVFLAIEADPAAGFESGFQATSLTAPMPIQFTVFTSRLVGIDSNKFRFALHDEDFIDKVGKFFGMEDVRTGYKEFDKKLVVKTNDGERVKKIFEKEATRSLFEGLGGFDIHIAYYDDQEDKHCSLELSINSFITDATELEKIYCAFTDVLKGIEATKK